MTVSGAGLQSAAINALESVKDKPADMNICMYASKAFVFGRCGWRSCANAEMHSSVVDKSE